MRRSGLFGMLVITLVTGALVASSASIAAASPVAGVRSGVVPHHQRFTVRRRVPAGPFHRRPRRHLASQAVRRPRRDIHVAAGRRARRPGLGAPMHGGPAVRPRRASARGYSAVRVSQTVVHVQGTIKGAVTWSAANVYEIVGPITIAATGVLTIQPGTVVHVNLGEGITVLGSLQAVGTSAAPITFSPTSNPQPGDWNGISATGAGSINLQHAAVSYAYVSSQSSSAATLIGDTFNDSSGGAVYLDDGQSDTVKNNGVVNPNGIAYTVHDPALNFGLLSGNSASGTGVLVFVVTGAAVTSAWTAQPVPWSLGDGCCTLDVPAGVTVTVKPGVVVKSFSNALTVEGHLKAVGTAASPIVWTSLFDNSVDGNSSGTSTAPQPGDWNGISASGAGVLNLQHATVSYAYVSSQSSAAATLIGDTFNDSSGGAVYLDDGQSDTVENNTAVNPGGVAFVEHDQAVNFGLLSGNSASGAGVLVFVVTGAAVTSAWTAQPVPWSLGDGCCTLDVPAGVTVTMKPGVVVKSFSNALTVEGHLKAFGTAANPIVWTSLFDNSVDGNSSGTSTAPQPGDWNGISATGAGSINLQHATVSYAYVSSQSSSAATLIGDTFNDSSGGAVYLDDGQSDTVENNGVVNPNGIAYTVHDPAVNFGLLSGNSASGTGVLVFVVTGAAVTSAWTAQPVPWSLGDGCCTLDVPAGVTVTMDPGVVVKSYANALTVEGTLSAVGTAASPIVWTSLFDNSVDGNSTGTSTTPQPGDWAGIEATGAGAVNLQDITLSYASTALYADTSAGSALNAANLTDDSAGIVVQSGAVGMRGSITGTPQAAVACAWDSGASPCSIDAAYTYWGPKGPSLAGGTLACGAVTVSPYLTATGSKTVADAKVPTCGGGSSSSPSAELTSAQAGADQWVAGEQIQCDDGYQDACAAIKAYERCFAAAAKLAGAGAPWPPPSRPASPSYGVKILDSFQSWILGFTSPNTVFGLVLGSALTIFNAVQVMYAITKAYNTCFG